MLHVRLNGHTESLFAAFHKVATATAMYVHLHSARHYITSLSVNDFCVYDMEITVRYGQYLVAVDNNRAAFQPALWSKNATVDYLF